MVGGVPDRLHFIGRAAERYGESPKIIQFRQLSAI
jgi:hypothetical protein